MKKFMPIVDVGEGEGVSMQWELRGVYCPTTATCKQIYQLRDAAVPQEMPTNCDPSACSIHPFTCRLQLWLDLCVCVRVWARRLHRRCIIQIQSRILTQDLFPFKSCVEKFAAAAAVVGSKRQKSNV